MNEFAMFLQENLGEHEPKEIEELILDDLFKDCDELTEEHKIALEQYSNLIHLSINGLGLKTLKNFPCIPNLYILQVKNNKLTGEDFDEILKLYPGLYKLKVSNNLIESINVFAPLEKSKIKKIEIEDNPVNLNDKYREELFNIMPNLISINRKKKDGELLESTIYNEGSENSDEDDYDGEDEEYEEKEDENDEEESFGDDDEEDD